MDYAKYIVTWDNMSGNVTVAGVFDTEWEAQDCVDDMYSTDFTESDNVLIHYLEPIAFDIRNEYYDEFGKLLDESELSDEYKDSCNFIALVYVESILNGNHRCDLYTLNVTRCKYEDSSGYFTIVETNDVESLTDIELILYKVLNIGDEVEEIMKMTCYGK